LLLVVLAVALVVMVLAAVC